MLALASLEYKGFPLLALLYLLQLVFLRHPYTKGYAKYPLANMYALYYADGTVVLMVARADNSRQALWYRARRYIFVEKAPK